MLRRVWYYLDPDRRELCAEVGDGEGDRRRIMGVSKPPLKDPWHAVELPLPDNADKELRDRSAFPALLGTLSTFVRITIVLGVIFIFLLVMLF